MPTTSRHPFGTPAGLSPNTGPLASAAWIVARDIYPEEAKWFIELSFVTADAQFDLSIYAEEWGFRFERAGRVTWIRVTDVVFVHGRDDHQLLGRVPPLRDIERLFRELETEHEVHFPRDQVRVTTSIPDAAPALQRWALAL